ncbi:MAG: tRNA-specific adenosine deaminase [Chloroflexi bacterium]|nr:tRNA-specific adenosine deaminase [Chloroflexota bacterium]|tara:strand:- start:318 stop:770 length:453 start_codon:yes stop_codon:yes gene_type:complete
MNDTELMQIAINEAIKGLELGDQPFGAVLVMDGKIIRTGRNLVYSTFDPTAHAETVTLRDAGTSIKTLNFPGATLYASWEPCPMCLGAIISARINRLVLGGRKSRRGSQYGKYTVEKLIELTNVKDKLTLTTGILQKTSEKIVNQWIDSK